MTTASKTSPLVIGVTGGIGSGKSEVCAIFSSLGATTYSADILARKLIETDPKIRALLQKSFGTHLYENDGSLNRKQLAKLAFGDDTLLARLNAIVHPTVIETLKSILREEKRSRSAPMIIVEAALIYEAAIERIFDYVIVVDAGEPERVERVIKRDSSTRADILRRMKAQLSPEEKAERADFVLRNTGTLTDLRTKCEFLFSLLMRMGAVATGEA